MVWAALAVAVLLAAITGFVDAVAYDRFLGVFPANQSGKEVRRLWLVGVPGPPEVPRGQGRGPER
jgi:hypothetical protein